MNGDLAEVTSFQEYAASQGIPIIDYSDDDEITSAVANFYVQSQRKLKTASRGGKPMILDFHLIDLPGLNAFAISLEDADAIALFKDVWSTFIRAARAVTSHGHMFPQRRTPNVDLTPIVSSLEPAEIIAGAPWDVEALRDPALEEVALAIARGALQFVLQHELAHIHNGHCDYIGARQPVAILAELAAAGAPSPRGRDRETLEWDADCAAVEQVLFETIQPAVYAVQDYGVWALRPSNDFGTLEEGVQLAVYSAMLPALLFSASDTTDPEDPSPRTHPHPLFRVVYASHAVNYFMGYRTGSPVVVRDDTSTATYALLDSWFAAFPAADKFAMPDRAEVLDREYPRRRESWEDEWEKMHDELDALKRGGILAPPRPGAHPAFPDVRFD